MPEQVLLFFDREKQVGFQPDNQRFGFDQAQCFFNPIASAAHIMGVHHFRQVPIAIGIKTFYQFFALVILVGSGFKVINFFIILLLLRYGIRFVPAVGK